MNLGEGSVGLLVGECSAPAVRGSISLRTNLDLHIHVGARKAGGITPTLGKLPHTIVVLEHALQDVMPRQQLFQLDDLPHYSTLKGHAEAVPYRSIYTMATIVNTTLSSSPATIGSLAMPMQPLCEVLSSR